MPALVAKVGLANLIVLVDEGTNNLNDFPASFAVIIILFDPAS